MNSCLLSPKQIHIWTLSFSQQQKNLLDYFRIINKEEKVRANRFHFDRDRHAFVIARASLRILLSRYLNCLSEEISFVHNDFGKPALLSNQLQFNVSHSADMALYAITLEKPVGVDVECIDRSVEYLDLAKRFFSPAEVKMLAEDLTPENFFRIWTRKEAFIKAVGEGLSFPLDQFSVNVAENNGNQLMELNHAQYALKDWSVYRCALKEKHYLGAVATNMQNPKFIFNDFD